MPFGNHTVPSCYTTKMSLLWYSIPDRWHTAQRTWPIKLVYAWTVQIPRLDKVCVKILIYSKKCKFLCSFCFKSLYLFMPQMLFVLSPAYMLPTSYLPEQHSILQDWQGDFCVPLKEWNVCPWFVLLKENVFCVNPPTLTDYLVLHLVEEKKKS